MSTELNYWFDTSQFRLKLRSELPKQANTIVIGGGIAGIATLYFLRQAGVDAILLDKGDIGFKSSGRNNGNISLPQFFDVQRKQFSVLYGVAKYNNQIIRQTVGDLDIKCGLGYAGEVQLYIDKKPTRIPNENCWLMNHEEIDFLVTGNKIGGGLYLPVSAMCNTYQLLHGLVSACELEQNTIFSHVDIRKMEKRFGKIYLHTSDDHILSCKNVVLCTNSYFGLENLRPRSFIKKMLGGLCYETFPGIEVLNFPPLTMQIIDHNLRVRIYKKRLFIDYEKTMTHKELYRLIGSLFPLLKKYDIQYYWSDNILTTKDKLPLIGQVEKNVYINSLFGRNGMAFCFYGAKNIANYIGSGDEDDTIQIFQPKRLKKGKK